MNIFGFHFIKSKDYKKLLESNSRSIEYLSEKIKLEEELKNIRARLFSLEEIRPKIDINIGDPSPVDYENRKLYVAAVAGLHKDILSPKLYQMISKNREEMDNMENVRDLDLVLKGVSYALWELDRWGNQMIGEQIENQKQEEIPEKVEEIKN